MASDPPPKIHGAYDLTCLGDSGEALLVLSQVCYGFSIQNVKLLVTF